MVIDVAKGVEERTINLMEVCRLRTTPILTFINKLDREGRDPIDLMDEVEQVLKIKCAPMTWPIGMGKRFKGVYHLYKNEIHLFSAQHGGRIAEAEIIKGLILSFFKYLKHLYKLKKLLGVSIFFLPL